MKLDERHLDLYSNRHSPIEWKVMLLDQAIQHKKYCNNPDQNLDRKDISNEINLQPNDGIKINDVIQFDYTSFIGPAKSGKTLFLLKAAYEFRNEFDYIFYCDINKILGSQSCDIDLFDLLTFEVKSCFWFDEESESLKVFQNILISEKILLIIDHMEKLNLNKTKMNSINCKTKCTLENLVSNILTGNLLSKSKKIIISRPYNLEWMQKWPEFKRPRQINVLGINHEDQKKFIENKHPILFPCIFHTSPIISDFWSFCFAPFFCLMLEECFRGKYIFQLTTTYSFALIFFRFVELEFDGKCNVMLLAKFAFSQFSEAKLCFCKEDLSKAKLSNYYARSFLITPQNSLYEHAYSHFSHILFQEFLVALYLISLPRRKFQRIFRSKLSQNRYQIVCKFVFGLCQDMLKAKLKKILKNKFKNLCANKKFLKNKLYKKLNPLLKQTNPDITLITLYSEYLHEMCDNS